MGFYVYRTTTEKLADALDRITDAGDTVREPVHVGGRDWVLICLKGRPVSRCGGNCG